MRISILGSGSGGNAVYIVGERCRLLIDAGLAPREVDRRLRRLAGPTASVDALDAVLLTHEHGDHAKHADAFADAGIDLYATDGTALALGITVRNLSVGRPHRIGELEVLPVAVPHDAVDPVGYLVSDGVSKVGILTDCGWDDPEVARAFAGVDLLVMEFNYDDMLLEAGPYPRFLKRRIGGPRGHLSNRQAASLLRKMCLHAPPPRLLVLAHLSQVNNRPRIATAAALEVMRRKSQLLLADQTEASPWLDPAAGDGRSGESLHGVQMGLPFFGNGLA